MKIRSITDLERIKNESWQGLQPDVPTLAVGMASCGIAAGAAEVYERALLRAEGEDQRFPCRVVKTGCIGFCQAEPLVEVRFPVGHRFLYGPVKPREIGRLVEKWRRGIVFGRGRIGRLEPLPNTPPDLDYLTGRVPDHPFYRGQVRIATRRCGFGDPEEINHTLALGGYEALATAVTQLIPDEIIRIVTESGLRGRGGAGFPTGVKWKVTAEVPGDTKYIIANADEGDPGAYMDRSLLEGDPHAVIEGMAVGGCAVGARRGIIFVRTEYPLAVQRLQKAVADARERGLLGENILGSDFSFDIDIVEGAGAFVSGEETALIACIEGRIAEPRTRPPYPAVEGLWGCPTVINNVETWADVPAILRRGSEWYSGFGTPDSKGTKVFSLVGAIRRTGSVEVPLGTPLRSIVEDVGGGAMPGRTIKAVQTGGPSGGCIPAARLDLAVDYATLAAEGSIMGSGGMVVMDDRTCMVDIARFFLEFTRHESCGKCTPCREGLDRMVGILEGIVRGEGEMEDLDRLEQLARGIGDASLCGLGKSAPNPVLTTLRDFRDEYIDHIRDGRCPAGVCTALIQFAIDPDLCTGCMACLRTCPVDAVSGEKNRPHVVDPALCIKCGACRDVCPVDAVRTDG
jgi:NADH:ubiquinone oxidoreductase subunit F (NADH-binding)/NAD-dependent dihydropyrimidine dehydrogenase PreA subunit/(2Fe-2S) ferredoxin